jgi:molecular chaperone DnaK (HSP70)
MKASTGWALDLGTTNTILTCWDREADRPRVFEMPAICRAIDGADPLQAPHAVPSAVQVIEHPGLWARMTTTPFLARHFSWGKLAVIGRPALEANAARARPNFVASWKRELTQSPLATVARIAGRSLSAREINRLFLRELFAEVKRQSGEHLRDLVVTVPVEAYETYRAELLGACRSLGIGHIRFLDEPVAAALGYGLGIEGGRKVLVVDMGGGTMHLALVSLRASRTRTGLADVVAKTGRAMGGNLVDRWLVEDLCDRREYTFLDDESPDGRLWRRLMLAEACRVKEALFLKERAAFSLEPFEECRRFEARLATGVLPTPELAREDLVRILTERGFYRTLQECIAEVLASAQAAGVTEADVDQVLMVGGSTLLPDVYTLFESRFGRERVRAWQPFEAVGFGASAFAADRIAPSDFIVHDYALLTYDRRTQAPEYTVIVPRGSRFPTPMDLWKRALVPTCSLGEPERIFKLVICEVGDGHNGDERRFGWDASGRLHSLGGGGDSGSAYVVKLNEGNPTLGYLEPPHQPGDKRPRLEVGFGVNAERWLCATVTDLATRKRLMREEPVVRLL